MTAQRIAGRVRRLCSPRTAALLVVTVLLVAAGVATASIIRPGAGADGMIGPDAFAWDGTPPSLPVTVDDPAGHQRWTVRKYQSKDGFPCLEVGRLSGQEDVAADFGRVNADGTFTLLPIEDGGSPINPSDASEALLVNHYRATATTAAQVAVFGMVTSDVQSVVLRLASGATTVPVANGVFLAVLPETDLQGAEAEFNRSDDTSKTYELHSKPPAGSGEPPSGL
jgi:hypothetical protein